MANGQNGSASATFAFATIFLLGSLAMIAVAFSTNHWQEVYVSNTGIDPAKMISPEFFTRSRGLFRTCYPANAAFLDKQPNLVDGKCLSETGYEVPNRNPETLKYGSNYEIKMHLLRAHFAALVLAMLFLFVGCITGVLACWNSSPSMMRSTGVLVFVAMFFCAAGMVTFHVVYYLEERVLTNVPRTLAYIKNQALSNVDYARLDTNTQSTFGYSYILGWLGLAFAALSGILYLIVGYKFSEKAKETYGKKRSRSRAYEYMDRNGYPYGDSYGGAAGPYPPQDVMYVDSAPYDVYSGYRY